ncbi:MAG: hypothetical protein RLZZ22_356, partial [Pseudomonadota bacterium]
VLLTGAAASDGLTVALGDGAALHAAGLPLFGDINGDGMLSQGELDAGHVTLAVGDAAQLGEAAALAGDLHAAGIDAVRMDLADANSDGHYDTELLGLLGDSALNADFAALHGAGLANQIDLGGAGEVGHLTLSDMQAQALIGAGLEFAAGDDIALEAQGTHLSTSLKDLQKLGVDHVLLPEGAGHSLTLDLGAGATVPGVSGLPLFGDTDKNGQISQQEDQALDVTLVVGGDSELPGSQNLQGIASALAAAGIDHISVAQSQLDGLASDAALTALLNAGLDLDLRVDGTVAADHVRFEQAVDLVKNGVDLLPDTLAGADLDTLVQTLEASGLHSIDLQANASVTIGDDLAAALHDAGLLTALPQADIWLDTSAAQLQTSLKAMADLGVDKVASTIEVEVRLGADLGELATLLQSFVEDDGTSATKPLFDHLAQLDVGIVADDAAVQQTLSQAGVAQQLHDLGVSKVVAQVEVLGQSNQFQSLEWTFDATHHWTKTST